MSEAYTKPGVLYHLLNTLNQLAHTHRLAIVLTNQVIFVMFFVRFRYPVNFLLNILIWALNCFSFLCTGGPYYDLLISNKFLMGVSGPSRAIKFLYASVPPSPSVWALKPPLLVLVHKTTFAPWFIQPCASSFLGPKWGPKKLLNSRAQPPSHLFS